MAENFNPNIAAVTIKRVIRTAPKHENRDKRLKLLISIVNRGDDERLCGLLNDFSVSLTYACMGAGTAQGAVLNYLGIGTSEKRVMFSLIPESDETDILDSIRDKMSLYLVGRGISFTVPLSAASELISGGLCSAAASKTTDGRSVMKDRDRNFNLIIAVVAAGFVDEAVEAARSAGAAGGTILRARSVDNAKAEQFVGINLNTSSEILMILAQKEGSAAIMDALNDRIGLKTEARGVIYAVPVDRTVGVGTGQPKPPAEENY